MGDSLAQAALILVHLNLFSSTANWDCSWGLEGGHPRVCVFSSWFPGLTGGMFLFFGNVHLL